MIVANLEAMKEAGFNKYFVMDFSRALVVVIDGVRAVFGPMSLSTAPGAPRALTQRPPEASYVLELRDGTWKIIVGPTFIGELDGAEMNTGARVNERVASSS
jgi:hypothetical protein